MAKEFQFMFLELGIISNLLRIRGLRRLSSSMARLQEGEGMSKDSERAAHYLRFAADQGTWTAAKHFQRHQIQANIGSQGKLGWSVYSGVDDIK
jgi:hypothetical protein